MKQPKQKTTPTNRRKKAPPNRNQKPVEITDPEVQCLVRALLAYGERPAGIVRTLAEIGHQVRIADVRAFLEREVAGWRLLAAQMRTFGSLAAVVRSAGRTRESLRLALDVLDGFQLKVEATTLGDLRGVVAGAVRSVDGIAQGVSTVDGAREAIGKLDNTMEEAIVSYRNTPP
jgi:hypothetical protein